MEHCRSLVEALNNQVFEIPINARAPPADPVIAVPLAPGFFEEISTCVSGYTTASDERCNSDAAAIGGGAAVAFADSVAMFTIGTVATSTFFAAGGATGGPAPFVVTDARPDARLVVGALFWSGLSVAALFWSGLAVAALFWLGLELEAILVGRCR